MKNFIDDYAGDPTGQNNNLIALRAAISDCEQTGEKLYIPPGTYRVEVSSVADLQQGRVFKQLEDWDIEGSGTNTILDVYPKTLAFPFKFLGLIANRSAKIKNLIINGAYNEYNPQTQPWADAIYVNQGAGNTNHIDIENCRFTGVWNSGFFKEGGPGNKLNISIKNCLFDRSMTQAIGVFAGDDQEVDLTLDHCRIVEAGMPNWGHGIYIHPHVSVHMNHSIIEKAYKYGFNYYSNSGTQTIKPKYAIVENSVFMDCGYSAISHGGPEQAVLLSRNNTFYCNAFYYGKSFVSEDDHFIYGSMTQAALVGDSIVPVTYKFINPTAKNAKFRIASYNPGITQNVVLFQNAQFDNSYIEQTHRTPDCDQEIIINGMLSNNDSADYLFRPLAGSWEINGFVVKGSFSAAPWAAPLLTDSEEITRYKASNGHIKLTSGQAIINRTSGTNPLSTQNVDID